jgi:hypothetical protein
MKTFLFALFFFLLLGESACQRCIIISQCSQNLKQSQLDYAINNNPSYPTIREKQVACSNWNADISNSIAIATNKEVGSLVYTSSYYGPNCQIAWQ